MGNSPTIDLGTRVVPITPDMTFEPGDRLGNAVFEGYRPTHSEEWHEQRGTGYGGSDVAAICGCSKWTTAYQLWAERTGRVPREDDGKNVKAKHWGSLLEPVILAEFAAANPGLIVVTAPAGFDMSWRSLTDAEQLASPDALFYTIADATWGIVEAKTSRYDDDWKDQDNQPMVPEYYRTQEQWYLETFGFDLGIFAVLFAGSDDRTYPVPADAVEQRINRKQVEAFRAMVAADEAPPFTGTDGEVTYVRKQHPLIDDSEVDLGEVGRNWVQAKIAAAEAEANLNIAAAEVLGVMGTARKGLVEKKHVVSRQTRGSASPWLVKK